jgi:hypothetical protein
METMNSAEIKKSFAEQLSWPDGRLLHWAGEIVGIPKEDPADSFVLHAPLELMARATLLPLAPSSHREAARERLVWLVASYEEAGPAVKPPAAASPKSVEDAVSSLLSAVADSDLDEIDRFAAWLADNVQAAALRVHLGPSLAPSLAAAAHASIALSLMGRIPEIGASALRGAAREIGRHPDRNVDVGGKAAGDRQLADALLSIPLLGRPGSNFIFPMVAHGAEAARHLLADVSTDVTKGARSLSRVAAWSMLQETDEHVPYGWTHTLTIPQAVMSLPLDPRSAVVIAASLVVGFRASMGTTVLNPDLPVPAVEGGVKAELIAEALLHHDAHLVKYTLACLDAAVVDPDMSALYAAAAWRLAAWWRRQPGDGFFDEATG